MTDFTAVDVEKGEAVTLEHVPPKSFNAGGFAMCLTCAECNNKASRAEMAVVEAQREQKVQLDIPGLPIQTARISVDERGNISARLSKLRCPQDTFTESLRSAVTFKMRGEIQAPHYMSVPWLKAAYLSVFSLLSKHGYRYAEGKAIDHVREQIMKPSQRILRHFTFVAPSAWQENGGILMNSEQRPCWAVKMGGRLVLLPRGCDAAFYDWAECVFDQDSGQRAEICLGGGPMWYPVRFGRIPVVSIPFREGYDPRKQAGFDLFGRTGRVTWAGKVIPVVVADYAAEYVTVMSTEGLDSSC